MSGPDPSSAESRNGRVSEGGLLTLAGGLLLGGFVLNALVTSFLHPSGSEDDHPEIFAEYADSDAWVAIHVGQLAGVIIALAGLLVLYRVFEARGDARILAQLGAAATVMTAAVWAVLQGLDGVALKQAADAWVDASGSEKALRFGDAETLRWTEWGFQSYFRISLGLSLALFGVAILASRLVAGWLGWLALSAGLLSVALGIDVGYSGLESGFGDAAGLLFVLAVLIFGSGMVAAGRR
jgi:hypothetical protein